MKYDEFKQRVRRHRPSELLPAIARTSIKYFQPEQYFKTRLITPWALATAAKESIRSGNEFRGEGVRDEDIMAICSAYNSIRDPDLGRDSPIAPFFVRLGFEQFAYQAFPKNELARIHLLFQAYLGEVATRVITEASLTELLGTTIQEFIGAGWILFIGALQNGGYFDLQWLSQSNFEPVLEIVPKEQIEHVLTTLFATSVGEFKAVAEEWTSPQEKWRKFDYNPLREKPYLQMPDGRHLAPVVHLVLQRMSPATIYYLGVKKHGNVFAEDVGLLFQHYVGKQLALLRPKDLIREIEFDSGQRSADWLAIWDNLVLIVEVKSTRLTQPARMGQQQLGEEVERTLGKAFDQVSKTAKLIRERHPKFRAIPTDRPIVGMVLTLEPYYMANSPFVRQGLPESTIPTSVISVRELEILVAVVAGEGASDLILQVASDPEKSTWSLEGALTGKKLHPNSEIEEALRTYPWFNENQPGGVERA